MGCNSRWGDRSSTASHAGAPCGGPRRSHTGPYATRTPCRGLRQTTLEAETAGPFQPIVSRTLAEAAESLNPATDGIALRVKDRWWVRFPSSLRFTGSALGLSTLHELAAVSGLTPDTLTEYRRSGQATLYRFETIDLIQLPGEDLPRTYRRGDMHDGWECNRAAILTQLQLVTQYLASHLQLLQGDGSDETALVLRGDLLPFTGKICAHAGHDP